jgi:hypothetical protein
MSGHPTTTGYQPRPVRSLGILEVAGWRIKQYVMTVTPENVPDPQLLSATAALAAAALPAATATHGVGFLLAHQARPACFVLLDWWQDGFDLKQAYTPPLWFTRTIWWSFPVTRWAASGSLRCYYMSAQPGSITYSTASRMTSRPTCGTCSRGLTDEQRDGPQAGLRAPHQRHLRMSVGTSGPISMVTCSCPAMVLKCALMTSSVSCSERLSDRRKRPIPGTRESRPFTAISSDTTAGWSCSIPAWVEVTPKPRPGTDHGESRYRRLLAPSALR